MRWKDRARIHIYPLLSSTSRRWMPTPAQERNKKNPFQAASIHVMGLTDLTPVYRKDRTPEALTEREGRLSAVREEPRWPYSETLIEENKGRRFSSNV